MESHHHLVSSRIRRNTCSGWGAGGPPSAKGKTVHTSGLLWGPWLTTCYHTFYCNPAVPIPRSHTLHPNCTWPSLLHHPCAGTSECQAGVSLAFSLLTVLWTIKPTLDESHHSLCFCHVTLVRDNERCVCHSLAPLPMQSTTGYQNEPEGESIICVQEAPAPLPFLLFPDTESISGWKDKEPRVS